MIRHLIMVLLLLLLTGCGGEALYSQLSEQQVNEMVAVLQKAELPAKKRDLGKDNFAVTIEYRYFADAVEHLRAHGYPREQFDNLGSVFKKEGFVSSPLEENARLIYALSQEVAHTIASIDGVVLARVHLAMPEQNLLSDTIKPSSASVFIKHRGGIDLSGNISQIKSLVVNGIEGLPYDNVTVGLFAMEPMLKLPLQKRTQLNSLPIISESMLFLAGLIGTVLLLGGGVWLWLRRRQRHLLPLSKEPDYRG